MAQVAFKKGKLATLPSTYSEGTFYVTTDERGLYLDISGSERIRLGDFQEVDTLLALESIPTEKRSQTALYYVKTINCLAKWNGENFIQINPDTGATDIQIVDTNDNGITASYSADGRKIILTISKKFVDENTFITKIGDIGSKSVKEYVDEKTTGIASDEALGALGQRVTTVEGQIAVINGEDGTAGSIKKALKDAKDYTDEKGTAMNARVQELEDTVDELDDTYAPIEHDHEIGDVTGLTEALAAKAANTDLEAAKGRISTLESQIGGLSGAMHFKGEVHEDPTEMSSFDGYASGDVVVYGEKEYVFDGEQFVEFGDVTAEGQRITALENKLNGVGDTVTGYVGGQITTAKTELIGEEDDVTATTIQGGVAEAEAYTDAAIEEIANGDEINDFAGVEDALDGIQNGTSINNFGAVETALAWGSF